MVLDDLGVLVGVDATAQAEVEDRGDGDVGVADLVELVDVDGADALDPGDAGAQRLVGEVDEEPAAVAKLGQARSRECAEPGEGLGRVVRRPRGPPVRLAVGVLQEQLEGVRPCSVHRARVRRTRAGSVCVQKILECRSDAGGCRQMSRSQR